MAKARKKKKYNLRTEIRSALRRLWMWSPMRKEAIVRAKVGKVYLCPECGKACTAQNQMDVDHTIKVTPANFNPNLNPREWGIVIENMLYMKPETLVAMCKDCHKEKTADEKEKVKAEKAALKSGDVGRIKRADTSGAGTVVSKSSRRPRKKGIDKPE